ncbi:MAG: hypothetical protein JWO94_1509 [Verrucomicrobiaceae bacterium]|nr:hypothetical protein [Verrucomicrobiaceae bacterium]
MLSGCTALKEKVLVMTTATAAPPATTGADVSGLLSMSFTEAAAIAPQHLETPKMPRMAADSIEVLSKTSTGEPRRVRAKGRVFLQLDQMQQAHALCDEALVSQDELILRGKPVLQRGSSTVEGLSDVTVFYLFGQQLKVIGRHRVSNGSQLAGASPPWTSIASNGGNGGSGSLLPPLDTADVPEAVRDEMRKAAEAEAQLQRSRAGLPPAFPDALDGSHHPTAGAPMPMQTTKDRSS